MRSMLCPIHMLPWCEQGCGRHAVLVAVAGPLLLLLLAIFGGDTFQNAAMRRSTAGIGLVSLRASVPSRMRMKDAAGPAQVEAWLVKESYVRKKGRLDAATTVLLQRWSPCHLLSCGAVVGPASVLRLVRRMLEEARQSPPHEKPVVRWLPMGVI